MAERMTVNHDVTGSSPVRGATRGWIFQPLFLFCTEHITSDISLYVILYPLLDNFKFKWYNVNNTFQAYI